MPTPSPAVARARATSAALRRHRHPDDPAVADAARNLKALVTEQYAREVVSSWPPLTAEQRLRLAAIFASAPDREAAA